MRPRTDLHGADEGVKQDYAKVNYDSGNGLTVANCRQGRGATVGLVSAAEEQKLTQLGFSPGGLGMELTIGNLTIQVVECPMRMISMSSFGPRSMCSYDVKCPTSCSKEQIAGLIYLNVGTNFRNDAELLKAHFQSHGLLLFQ